MKSKCISVTNFPSQVPSIGIPQSQINNLIIITFSYRAKQIWQLDSVIPYLKFTCCTPFPRERNPHFNKNKEPNCSVGCYKMANVRSKSRKKQLYVKCKTEYYKFSKI